MTRKLTRAPLTGHEVSDSAPTNFHNTYTQIFTQKKIWWLLKTLNKFTLTSWATGCRCEVQYQP